MNSIPLFTFVYSIFTSDLKNWIRGRLINKNNPKYHTALKEFKKDGIKVRTVLNPIKDIIKKEKEKIRPYNKNSWR